MKKYKMTITTLGDIKFIYKLDTLNEVNSYMVLHTDRGDVKKIIITVHKVSLLE